jgi:hypothetical protein
MEDTIDMNDIRSVCSEQQEVVRMAVIGSIASEVVAFQKIMGTDVTLA